MLNKQDGMGDIEAFFWNQAADWSQLLHDLNHELEFRRVPTARRLAQAVRAALLFVPIEVPVDVGRPYFRRTCFELVSLFGQQLSEYYRALRCCQLEIEFVKLTSETAPPNLPSFEERIECEALFTEELTSVLNTCKLLADA